MDSERGWSRMDQPELIDIGTRDSTIKHASQTGESSSDSLLSWLMKSWTIYNVHKILMWNAIRSFD